jgi:hypothetical protein
MINYGMCYVDPNNKRIWVNIHKNASTSMKALCQKLGWQLDWFNKNTKLNDYEALVITRDPIERWISGFCQYYHGKDINKLDSSIFDTITFDHHTGYQWDYVKGLSKIIKIRLDDNFNINIKKHFGIEPIIDNTVAESKTKQNIKQRLLEILDRDRLEQHFKKDIEFVYDIQ